MQGVLVFLVFVVLYLIARSVRKGVESHMEALRQGIDESFTRSGSHSVEDLVNAQYVYRNPYAHTEYPVILALTKKALNMRHWGVGYFAKRRVLAAIEARHIGLLGLVKGR